MRLHGLPHVGRTRLRETAATPAPPTDIHDLDPQQFLEEVHSFDFWFEAVEGDLTGLRTGTNPTPRKRCSVTASATS